MSDTYKEEEAFTAQEQKRLKSQIVEAKIANELYLRRHPEVAAVIGEVYRQVLLRRPDEPVAYVEDFLATTDLQKLHEELMQKQRAEQQQQPAAAAADGAQ